MTDVFGVETIELDLPPLVGALSRRLHERGLPITPGRSADFARALTVVRPIGRHRLYWTARAVFVSDDSQVKAFDEVFFSIFGDREAHGGIDVTDARTVTAPPDDRAAREREGSSRVADLQDARANVTAVPAGARNEDEESVEVEVPLAIASSRRDISR